MKACLPNKIDYTSIAQGLECKLERRVFQTKDKEEPFVEFGAAHFTSISVTEGDNQFEEEVVNIITFPYWKDGISFRSCSTTFFVKRDFDTMSEKYLSNNGITGELLHEILKYMREEFKVNISLI